jgi:hypothetical protein
MTDFAALPRLTQARLAELSSSVSGVVPLTTRDWTLTTRSPRYVADAGQIVKEVEMWAGGASAFLYVFRLVPPYPELGEVAQSFSAARAAQRGSRAYPRLNGPSACVYVGSSQKLHRRFRDHFGFGSPGTYALQLQHWASDLDLCIRIECARYPDDLPPNVTQSLEDTLWSQELPMFGRRGAK